MTIRASVDNKFIRRFLYISIGCFLFMLWGLYDGLYTSPRDVEIAKAYKELSKKREAGEITEDERGEMWKELATKNKWPLSKPKEPHIAQGYVYFQWFVFGTGLILGVFFLIKYLRLRNSWMEADETAVTTSWGPTVKFDDIETINKHKWEKKGIARVHYKDDSGTSKIMVFDDFKYNRETMGQIMEMAEKNLTDEQIVGGVRESAKKEDESTGQKETFAGAGAESQD